MPSNQSIAVVPQVRDLECSTFNGKERYKTFLPDAPHMVYVYILDDLLSYIKEECSRIFYDRFNKGGDTKKGSTHHGTWITMVLLEISTEPLQQTNATPSEFNVLHSKHRYHLTATSYY